VDYNGTFYVRSLTPESGYIGLVVGYQSPGNMYLIVWRRGFQTWLHGNCSRYCSRYCSHLNANGGTTGLSLYLNLLFNCIFAHITCLKPIIIFHFLKKLINVLSPRNSHRLHRIKLNRSKKGVTILYSIITFTFFGNGDFCLWNVVPFFEHDRQGGG
jgi:hypothetical protein